ncbi:MAG: TIGR02147 family protein, partial [Pseudobdellovibrionaceae bacterium]
MSGENNLSILDFQCYRTFLKYQLNHRISKNRNYSLRSFAKSLDMKPSFLSEVLNFKKHISLERAYVLSKILFKSSQESSQFVKLVELDQIQDEDLKNELKINYQKQNKSLVRSNLQKNSFEQTSQWFHFAILEMLSATFYQTHINQIQKILGLESKVFLSAIEDLIHSGLVIKSENTYKKADQNLIFKCEEDYFALKRLHQQMLLKAQTAVFRQSVNDRWSMMEFILLDKNQFKKAQKIMEDALDQVIKVLQNNETPLSHSPIDSLSLYHLNLQLFSLEKGAPDEA